MTKNVERRDRWMGRAGVLRVAVCAGLVSALAGGCHSYERRPLDLAGHRAAFLSRTPESPEVRAFAAGLEAARLAGVPAGTFDVADGVTCAEAEAVAMAFNAELRLSRLRAGVAAASADQAGLWEDPTLGVDLARIIQSTPEPWKVFTTLGLTIPISGRLEIEKQRAGMEHAAALARVGQSEWGVRMAIRRVWTEWSGLDAQLRTTREFVARVEQILTVVDKMEQAGEMARTEARLFRIERATKLSELAVIGSRARELELKLRQLMGMSPDAAVVFQATGIGPAVTARASGTAEADRAGLETSSPSMLVAAAEYEAAERSLELEIRKQYPDLHLGPGVGREDGQDQVTLGLSLPLPVLNGNRRGIAEARAGREVARASAEATLEQLVAGLRAAEERLRSASERRAMLEAEIVPLVDAQYADARELARLGEVNTLVLLESLSRQQEAKLSLIGARQAESLAEIDIVEIIGPAAGGNVESRRSSDTSIQIEKPAEAGESR